MNCLQYLFGAKNGGWLWWLYHFRIWKICSFHWKNLNLIWFHRLTFGPHCEILLLLFMSIAILNQRFKKDCESYTSAHLMKYCNNNHFSALLNFQIHDANHQKLLSVAVLTTIYGTWCSYQKLKILIEYKID